MDGSGHYYFPNGKVYEGKFKDNKMHGTGVLIYIDGRKESCTHISNKKSGKSTITYPNGKTEVQQYLNGILQNF